MHNRGGAVVSYLTALLAQAEPLEPHEVAELRRWLEVLRGDCEVFGETAEDTARMARITARIEREEGADGR